MIRTILSRTLGLAAGLALFAACAVEPEEGEVFDEEDIEQTEQPFYESTCKTTPATFPWGTTINGWGTDACGSQNHSSISGAYTHAGCTNSFITDFINLSSPSANGARVSTYFKGAVPQNYEGCVRAFIEQRAWAYWGSISYELPTMVKYGTWSGTSCSLTPLRRNLPNGVLGRPIGSVRIVGRAGWDVWGPYTVVENQLAHAANPPGYPCAY